MLRLFVLASTLALLAAAVGCGGGSNPPPATPAPAPMPTSPPSGPGMAPSGPGAMPAASPDPAPTPEVKPDDKPKAAQDNSDNPFAGDPPRSGKKTVTGAIGRALKKSVGIGGSGKNLPEAPSFKP